MVSGFVHFKEKLLKHTNVKSFIGTEFINLKGNILKVIDIDESREKSGEKKYRVTCSECSKDTELFPSGYFVSTKSNLNAGKSPCWCSKPRPTIEQAQVVTKRKLDTSKYKFIGIDKYEGKSSSYIITLECIKHSGVFTVLYQTFVTKGTKGCSLCFKTKIQESCGKTDDHFIDTFFKTGKFKDGTKFWRNTEKTGIKGNFVYWNYYCPECSNDEYVENGLCSGVFTSTVSNLRSGCLACRCGGKQSKWTAEQRTYQIKKVVNKVGGNFIGWVGGYENSNSRFNWSCQDGHLCNSKCEWAFYDLRCSTCSDRGFSKDLPASFYITKWYNSLKTIIKFGITNKTVLDRVEQQARKCGMSYEILYDFKFQNGLDAWIIENDLVKANKDIERPVVPKSEMEDGYTETTHYYNLNKILKIVEDYNNSLSH